MDHQTWEKHHENMLLLTGVRYVFCCEIDSGHFHYTGKADETVAFLRNVGFPKLGNSKLDIQMCLPHQDPVLGRTVGIVPPPL